MRGSLIVGVIAGIVAAMLSGLAWTPYDNYVLLADAFLHGHVWINWPGESSDALLYHGLRYVIEGPLPAVLMIPAVAIFGNHANETYLAPVFVAIAVGAAWEFARRVGCSRLTRAWICGFLFFGTDLAWCASYGDVWFLAHLSALAFTMLALVELAGAKRVWLIAIFGICASFSRFSLVTALPVYALFLYFEAPPENRRRVLLSFVGTLIPFALVWMGYNLARWGLPYDVGYTAWYHHDDAGSPIGSPFQLRYFRMEFESFFLRKPSFMSHFPYVVPSEMGMALTWTSPALILMLRAHKPVRFVLMCWAAMLLAAAPSFLYYVNGFAQFGMRHALDFEAFSVALIALGARRRIPVWGLILIGYSMLVGAWGVWFWHTYYRA
ncbi:MAG TPA: hypothetical protein VGZ00_04545 [Candidatus Baltobacteraceae bacterium]|jgi:hypothetical protein|nr:hypothetical protein [Candidatus Baltobacteraceae bacterium]